MPKTKKDNPAELLHLAITGLDEQIAELQEIQTKLAAMIGRPSTSLAVEAAAPQKRRKLSAEAREKISAAAKSRWARDRKAKAQRAKPATEKAKSKSKPAKAQRTIAKKKKSLAKEARPKPPTKAKENEAEKVSK